MAGLGNAVSELQNLVAKTKIYSMPEYNIVCVGGPSHAPTFAASVSLNPLASSSLLSPKRFGEGSFDCLRPISVSGEAASTKKDAKQNAAVHALHRLQEVVNETKHARSPTATLGTLSTQTLNQAGSCGTETDYVSKLQVYTANHQLQAPNYQFESTGTGHLMQFIASISLTTPSGRVISCKGGAAPTKKQAKQFAACVALHILQTPSTPKELHSQDEGGYSSPEELEYLATKNMNTSAKTSSEVHKAVVARSKASIKSGVSALIRYITELEEENEALRRRIQELQLRS